MTDRYQIYCERCDWETAVSHEKAVGWAMLRHFNETEHHETKVRYNTGSEHDAPPD